jgi:hypothetical protein
VLPSEAIHWHLDAADFGHDVAAARQLRDRGSPRLEDLVVLAGVGAEAERAAEVVEDDRRVRERPREVGQLRDLRVVRPTLEGHAVPREPGVPAPELGVEQQVGWLDGGAL